MIEHPVVACGAVYEESGATFMNWNRALVGVYQSDSRRNVISFVVLFRFRRPWDALDALLPPSLLCHEGIFRDFPHCQFGLYSNSQVGRWHLQARLHADAVGRRHIMGFDHAVTGTCPAPLTAIDTCYPSPLSETATKKRM